MDDTLEIVREEMEVTKSQLAEKVESLELQLSETVRSTGTAVNSTVQAVQSTVETVTEAVQDAVQSVSNAFDVRRQIDRHPWLLVSGSVALGYLAVGLLSESTKQTQQRQETASPPDPTADTAGHGNGERTPEPAAMAAAISTNDESGWKAPIWHQLRIVAISALVGILQGVASRAVPRVMEYLTHGDRAAEDAEKLAQEPTGPNGTYAEMIKER